MPKQYRVIDVTAALTEPGEQIVEAGSPESAASQLLGIELVRSGAKTDLMARVYWQLPGQPTNMVRLYRRTENERSHRRVAAE